MADRKRKIDRKIRKTGIAYVDPTKRYDYPDLLSEEYSSDEPMPILNHDKSKRSKKIPKS
ncbi:MAG: hypothetical protein FWE36_07825 [Erysipelotrichales bacterium]|nr:hypothetical protein [Erysipelotrichales bacterium]